jgi:hypothetical protein
MTNSRTNHSKLKLLSVVIISVILCTSLVPNVSAISVDEEISQAASVSVDPLATLPVPVIGASTHVPGHVDLELQLLMDVSGSVDDSEFLLQRTGYSDAFRDPGTLSQILGCGGGAIAVQLIYWSGSSEQAVAVDWTIISDAASATAFADAVDAAARPFAGLTAPGSAINFGAPLFSNAITSDRQVIDVSGDGAQNSGADTSDARDAALASGIDAINGLVILGEAGLETFYNDNVKGGSGAFVLVADDFVDFEQAIKDKLGQEICGTVAGELLATNTVSLFVAGLYANALWMVPVLGSVAGLGAYLIKTRSHKEL